MRMRIFLIAVLFLTGCSHLYLNHVSSMERCAERIAIEISEGLAENHMGMSMLVTTPLDAVTLMSSDFGLAMQELLLSAMAEQKANVVDVQLRKEPYISCREGLIGLSRDAARIRQDSRADIILVSTYMAGKDKVILTTRAIDYTTNDVITSSTVTLARTAEIERLLRNKDQARLYEK